MKTFIDFEVNFRKASKKKLGKIYLLLTDTEIDKSLDKYNMQTLLYDEFDLLYDSRGFESKDFDRINEINEIIYWILK